MEQIDNKNSISKVLKIFFILQHITNIWFVSYLFMSFQFLIIGHGRNDLIIEKIFQYSYGYPYFFILFFGGFSDYVIRKKTGKYFSSRNWIDLIIAGVIVFIFELEILYRIFIN